MTDFKKLDVWKVAHGLGVELTARTAGFPRQNGTGWSIR